MIQKQKGTKDIFFEEIELWEKIEENIKEICNEYNIKQIRTPIFEATELFARGVGDETDIVNKEMYTFLDKGGRSITLRPELTAGVVRAYIENGFSSRISPVKLWYTGTMYRYEKMQKGRYREFSQFGVEIFGSKSILSDVEVISVACKLFERLGILDKLTLNLNSIGCKECRANYIKTLKEYLSDKIDGMCEDCKVRYNKNPMRIIDCKQEKCQEIKKGLPIILDYLCEDCKKDFEDLKQILNELNIKYQIDPNIVRGLDYYNKTVFEFISEDLNLAVGGGGRYDGLVENLEGNPTPAVGFGLGMDRIVLVIKEYINQESKRPDIYFLTTTKEQFVCANILASKLRNKGKIIETNISDRSFSAQLKYANKIKAKYLIVIGDEELENKIIEIKDLDTGNRIKIKLEEDEIMKNI